MLKPFGLGVELGGVPASLKRAAVCGEWCLPVVSWRNEVPCEWQRDMDRGGRRVDVLNHLAELWIGPPHKECIEAGTSARESLEIDAVDDAQVLCSRVLGRSGAGNTGNHNQAVDVAGNDSVIIACCEQERVRGLKLGVRDLNGGAVDDSVRREVDGGVQLCCIE